MRLLYEGVRGYVSGLTCLIVLLRPRSLYMGTGCWGCGFCAGLGSICLLSHWGFRTLLGV